MKDLTAIACNSTVGGFTEFDNVYYYSQLSREEQIKFDKLNLAVFAFGFGLFGGGYAAFGLTSYLCTHSFIIHGATTIGAALGAGLTSYGVHAGLSTLFDKAE